MTVCGDTTMRLMTSDLIRSRSNSLVKRLRALKQHAAGDLLLVEGPRLLEEALAAGVELVEAAASPKLLRHARGRALAEAVEARCPLRVVDDDLLASLSEVEASQGVLAVARRPVFDEARLLEGIPLLVVAVGVQDPGNVGALLRTAEAAGATGAFLVGGADPFSWKALRGSMGSAFRLPHARVRDAGTMVAALRAADVRLLGTALREAPPYHAADFTGRRAILFGSEGAGLPPELDAVVDERVSIPMSSPVESLNVAVAAGVLLFEAARQRAAAAGWGGRTGRTSHFA
jgi:TrmH family RNA methyltransferase